MGITTASSILLLPLTAIVLIALQNKIFGFLLLALGALSLIFTKVKFRNNIVLIYASLGILGITPINTGIDLAHMLLMGIMLSLVLFIPYGISRYINHDHMVTFPFRFRRKWHRMEVMYLLLTLIVSYFVFPFALKATGSYLNWTVEPGVFNLFLLFIGTNALGIWDELFFINTVLGILRRFLPFYLANITQAFLFTSFLYELGFRGWLFIVIFFFALLQGFIYKKTDSLFYIIIIHLTADLILYLALISLHHPSWMPIFIT